MLHFIQSYPQLAGLDIIFARNLEQNNLHSDNLITRRGQPGLTKCFDNWVALLAGLHWWTALGLVSPAASKLSHIPTLTRPGNDSTPLYLLLDLSDWKMEAKLKRLLL